MSQSQDSATSLPAHLLHLATLELLTRSAPFSHSRTLPLHTLSDLVADYLQLLATAAKEHAELSGRDQVSVWDVGKALDEFGTGSLAELREEVEEGDGGEEGERLRDLAGSLRERLGPSLSFEPVAQLSYLPLSSFELDALATPIQLESATSDTDSSVSDGELEPRSPSPGVPPHVRIKEEDSLFDALLEQADDLPIASSWRDPNLIPSYVPAFLPPFPGMERERDVPEPVRRRRERDRERDAAAEAWAGAHAGSSQDPWIAAIPYASSSLVELHPASSLPPLSPPSRRRRRSLSPPSTASSLPNYHSLAPSIPHEVAWLRPNPKRRLAASAISLTTDMSISSDTLFGAIPVPPIHAAALTPGFLPDLAPPQIHPFNTSLPHTIALPANPHPTPHATLLAPPPHPRLPSLISSISAKLFYPNSPSLPLFSRLTRIGPPGPLGPSGEALDYEYVGNTSFVASNVEWPVRKHNARISKGVKDKDKLEAEGSGIRLNLKLGRGRSGSLGGASGAATPAPGESPGKEGMEVVEEGEVFEEMDTQGLLDQLQRAETEGLQQGGDGFEIPFTFPFDAGAVDPSVEEAYQALGLPEFVAEVEGAEEVLGDAYLGGAGEYRGEYQLPLAGEYQLPAGDEAEAAMEELGRELGLGAEESGGEWGGPQEEPLEEKPDVGMAESS